MGLLGSADENLRELERLLTADLHVRGNAVTLSGKPADVALAERAISELVAIVAGGQPLTPEGVRHSVAMLVGTGNESPAEVLTLDILSRRGKTIRPKTLNQKRYVDAIDNHTIVFGIGPAGTGKTYLAMAKAVQALQAKQVNRIVLTRFKDGYGPVGAYFLHLKTYTQNAYGQDYEPTWYESIKERVGDYVERHPVPTCLRNHALLEEVKAGRGPIRMVTKEAFKDPHKETVGWENFLGMTIGQAVVWASQNIDPKEINPELTTSEPYVMGSHATCSGAWASGPEDCAPSEYQWGYNRMMTVEGLFGAGDAIGGSAHKFSSGSFTEGRIAGKAAVKYVKDLGAEQPQLSEAEYEDLKKIVYKPLENYEVGRNEIVAGTVSPSYLLPIHGLQRLEKIMDEYVGGIGAHYTTNEPLLTRGLELLGMLKEDLAYLGAEDLHQLQRAWELQHRVLASECVTQHTLFRTETRWPGYYYRADHPKLDDKDWHCFTLSRYDRDSGKWEMEKAPVYHIVD